jgi:hypothetical protein
MHAEICCYKCSVCWGEYDDEDDAEECCSQYATDDMDISELNAIGQSVYADYMKALELAGQLPFRVVA